MDADETRSERGPGTGADAAQITPEAAVAPQGEPARARKFARKPEDDERELGQFIAKQIEIEQTLTATRMTWNLTFQGFTIAGFAILATASAATPSRAILQTLIAGVSLAIAVATLNGIVAAQRQREYLKESWRANGLDEVLPQPFSDRRGSQQGRTPAQTICWAIIIMWLVLPISAWTWGGDPEKAVQVKINADSLSIDRK